MIGEKAAPLFPQSGLPPTFNVLHVAWKYGLCFARGLVSGSRAQWAVSNGVAVRQRRRRPVLTGALMWPRLPEARIYGLMRVFQDRWSDDKSHNWLVRAACACEATGCPYGGASALLAGRLSDWPLVAVMVGTSIGLKSRLGSLRPQKVCSNTKVVDAEYLLQWY